MSCDVVAAMAAMARATSPTELLENRAKAGDSYRAKVIFAARDFVLHVKDPDAARRLLGLAPARQESAAESDDQEIELATLADGLCEHEPDDNMTALGRLSDGLSRLFAKAVLLAPDMMPRYVAYDLVAVGDPHNDANVQTEAVCRARYPEFLKAVAALPEANRDWFEGTVFDIRKCRALLLPESDD